MRIHNTVEDIEKVHTTTNFRQISSDYNSKNTYEGKKNLFERQPKESGSTTLMLSQRQASCVYRLFFTDTSR
jgi:hypothetical protein